VINVKAGQPVETGDAIQIALRQNFSQLALEVTIARRDGQAVPPEQLDLYLRRLFSLPGAGENRHRVSLRHAEGGNAHTVALQPAERKVIEEDEADSHWAVGRDMQSSIQSVILDE